MLASLQCVVHNQPGDLKTPSVTYKERKREREKDKETMSCNEIETMSKGALPFRGLGMRAGC